HIYPEPLFSHHFLHTNSDKCCWIPGSWDKCKNECGCTFPNLLRLRQSWPSKFQIHVPILKIGGKCWEPRVANFVYRKYSFHLSAAFRQYLYVTTYSAFPCRTTFRKPTPFFSDRLFPAPCCNPMATEYVRIRCCGYLLLDADQSAQKKSTR